MKGSSFALSVLPLLLALGCGSSGSDDDAPHDAVDSTPDGGAGPTARFAEPGPATLAFRETLVLQVLTRNADGRPEPDARVDLALEGDAHDSSLTRTELTTDAAGTAEASLIAGTIPSSFRIRASLGRGDADPGYLEVVVQAPGDVRVTLAPAYDGARRPATYQVRLARDAACPAVAGSPANAADTVLDVPADDPTFLLPAELLFASLRIGVAGLDGDAVVLWGCREGVTVGAAGDPALALPLIDLPWPRPGSHPLRVELPLASLAQPWLDGLFAPFLPVLEGRVSDGAFVVDGIRNALAGAAHPAAAVLDARRLLDGLDASVDELLTSVGGPFAPVLEGLRVQTEALDSGVFEGALELGEADTGNAAVAVDRWDRLVTDAWTVPLHGNAGLPLEATTEVAFHSARIDLGFHDIALSLGQLLDGVLIAALGAAYDSWPAGLTAWLQSAVPCDTVAERLAGSPELAAVCDAGCLQTACETWRSGLVLQQSSLLAGADAAATYLHLAADCSFLDDGTGRLLAEGRCSGALTGTWNGLSAAELSGTFSLGPAPAP